MNPIEHLWEHLKREVIKYSPTNIAELKEVVLKILNEISTELCIKLVYTMQKLIEAILRSGRRNTWF